MLIDDVKVSAYKIPTDSPESDGTIEWDHTTLVIVRISSGKKEGLGYSYGPTAITSIIHTFIPLLKGADPFENIRVWENMQDTVRNQGLPGIASHAISAVDIALWDLKAKLLDIPLCHLWGMARESVPVYGSGGFTSYSDSQLSSQFKGWQKEGITQFKMKVGRDHGKDVQRVKAARKAIGDKAALFVDANGGYALKEAQKFATEFAEYQVSWFEEPVSSDDVEGLKFLRANIPPGIDIAAGEYAYTSFDIKTFLTHQAVDVMQADATRCLGYTGFFAACNLSKAFSRPLSSHTAPSLHLHACLTQRNVRHMEYFHDHVRIEKMFFDGFPILREGSLFPHLDRPGHGLTLKASEVKKYEFR